MEMSKSIWRTMYAAILVAALLIATGCKESSVDPIDDEPTNDRDAMLRIAEEDSAIASFEPNFNDDGAISFLGKTQLDIYPLRIGTRVRVVQRSFTVDIVGDTAYGTYTRTFEGKLLIAASYDSAGTIPDTLIEKPFTSVITRKIIFVRIGNSDRPLRNWRIAAVSLAEGGTTLVPDNIDLLKVTVYLPNGDTLVIENPNEYFLSRGPGWWRNIPILRNGQSATVEVELTSAYQEPDFVVMTYGANRMGHHRIKKRFELVSTLPGGLGYVRVYSQTFTAHQFPGFYHSVISAFPKQVIFDDSAPVEVKVWGIPYIIRP